MVAEPGYEAAAISVLRKSSHDLILSSNGEYIVSPPKYISNLSNGTDTYAIKDAEARTAIANKQDTLVSGTNIKTINNNSLLGSGNITLDSLPSQSGNSGKFLTTNGSAASWATVTQPSIATTSTAGLVKPDGTTITITNDGTISVPEAVFIKNENTTPSKGLTIQGSTKNLAGINIGLSSVITAATAIAIGKSSNAGSNAVALGNLSAATGTCSVALGTNAKATTEYTISIGCFSTNYTTTRYTLNFGFGGDYTYTLLDGLTGLIPDARLSTNIARTSALPTTATTSTAGLVKPDGTTVTITNDGTISASSSSITFRTWSA